MIDVKKLRDWAARHRSYEWEELLVAPETIIGLLDRLEAAEASYESLSKIHEAMALDTKDYRRENEALAAHVEKLVELLERSQTGLEWYRDAYPEANSGADDEHATEVEEALAAMPRRQASGDSP